MTALAAVYQREGIVVYHLRDELAAPSVYALCERDSPYTVLEPEASVNFAINDSVAITCMRCVTMASRGLR